MNACGFSTAMAVYVEPDMKGEETTGSTTSTRNVFKYVKVLWEERVILIMQAHGTSPPSRRPAFTAEPSHSGEQEPSDTAESLCF